MLRYDQVLDILDRIEYRDWKFEAAGNASESLFFIYPTFYRRDSDTGVIGPCLNMRPWVVENWRDEDYVVKTVWMACLAAEEHEARERFLYKGNKIFGPHIGLKIS